MANVSAKTRIRILGITDFAWLALAVFALFVTRSSHGKAFVVLATFWLLEAARLVVVQFGGGAQYYAESARPTHPRWLVLNVLGIRTTHRNRVRYQRIATLFRFSIATGMLLFVLVHNAGVR
ncbi:MAG: hypothetical protein EPN53_01665 [Acidobacteria bacterium]|nr:MAG: hypothetical protein EPN53_01665 [Acidobacteriota bacterium]